MRARWALHPLTVSVVLLLVGGLGAVSALVTTRDLAAAGAVLLLALVAGAAAGFANSGST
ncbi:hypothetical protein GCM10009836_05510 [Pseudonocardia ailaonensis]|uniref:Uncharacterized protein n=2 Tax=Pseudonocardia ailaonensis TaxID=367279 RepID=A0ABN2MKF2_9PSEU